MIISRLQGGLGNQLFQYAAGREIATLLNRPHSIDISLLQRPSSGDTPRNFELGLFSENSRLLTEQELSDIGIIGPSRFTRLLGDIGISYKGVLYLRDKLRNYPSDLIYKNGKIVVLDGFWASESFFPNIAAELRHDFSKLVKAQIDNDCLLQHINSSNSVSIHVRRGDYISNKSAASVFSILDSNYYFSAIDFIKSICVMDCSFFIFTDDPEWVKKNFSILDKYILVSGTGKYSSLHEMFLMSQCKYNIIANSTFSWWAAWLNLNRNKTVVHPKAWFIDRATPLKFIPEGWITI